MRPRATLEQLLRASAIAFGAVNSVETFARHPQLRRATVTLASGQTADLVAPPIRHSFEDAQPAFGRVPTLGEHSASIRREFDAG